MKKVVRMLGLCALVALAFTSCKKNDNTNKVTFRATIAQPVSDDRTNLTSDNRVKWLDGDEIRLFDENGNTTDPFVATVGADNTTATFSGDAAFLSKLNEAGAYTAFYPVKAYDATTVTMAIPSSQNYVSADNGHFEDELFPMHATNDETGTFEFSSDAGVLRVGLYGPSTSMFNVKRVELVAPNGEILTGTLNYNNVSRAMTVTPSEQANKVVVNCGESGTTLYSDLAREFNFVVLGGTLNNGFTVNVVRSDDVVFSRTAPSGNGVAGGHIRTMINISLDEFTQVQ